MDGELDLLIDEYLAVLKVERGLGPATIEAYARDLTRFARVWGETPRPLAALDGEAVSAFLGTLTAGGLGARSQARYLSALRGFFPHCVEERHLARSPAALIASPKVGRRLPGVLSRDEVLRLIDRPERNTPRGVRDAAMLHTMYACGLRVSELVGLTLGDVNLEAGFVQAFGKGRKRRLVPLGADPTSGLQEFWHRPSANDDTPIVARGSDGQLPLRDRFGIIFVLLPPGRTVIGAQAEDPEQPAYDPGARIQESPLHEVTLAPFLLAKHELTQAQWLVLTGERTPSTLPAGVVRSDGKAMTVRHPVESASWGECTAVLQQHGLQLPTEAQWEYGCRAGSTTTWSTGAEPGSLQGCANLADASARTAGIAFEATLDDGHAVHAPVGSLRPNAFGLHDTIGNVAEWCREPFSSLAYLLPAGEGDGLRPVPEVQQRPLRGGSYEDVPKVATAAARAFAPATARTRTVGVRALRPLQP